MPMGTFPSLLDCSSLFIQPCRAYSSFSASINVRTRPFSVCWKWSSIQNSSPGDSSLAVLMSSTTSSRALLCLSLDSCRLRSFRARRLDLIPERLDSSLNIVASSSNDLNFFNKELMSSTTSNLSCYNLKFVYFSDWFRLMSTTSSEFNKIKRRNLFYM